ncbi:hypothetical protein ASJ81_21450 [Methanosarcina spelaei]|uniref:Uncharacterized protein n=2 Tax=Methanosarcina spelaei TaxID=1036679 RepID=A0A2A2HQZ4_9EURY|nr:hypothetical protein ASJ81_21450 [Methanosarcina spelaei]
MFVHGKVSILVLVDLAHECYCKCSLLEEKLVSILVLVDLAHESVHTMRSKFTYCDVSILVLVDLAHE